MSRDRLPGRVNGRVLLLRLLLITLLVLAPARADAPAWNIPVPESWAANAPDPGDESLLLRLSPKDPGRSAMVVIRRYHKDAPSLDDELTQLRYGVVLKLEGKILSQQPWRVAGQPGMKVVYEGRSSKGVFKTFVRYMATYDGDLLIVHCVTPANHPQDLLDFQAIAEAITVSAPASES